jgi:hypothetical protein
MQPRPFTLHRRVPNRSCRADRVEQWNIECAWCCVIAVSIGYYESGPSASRTDDVDAHWPPIVASPMCKPIAATAPRPFRLRRTEPRSHCELDHYWPSPASDGRGPATVHAVMRRLRTDPFRVHGRRAAASDATRRWSVTPGIRYAAR